MRNGKQPAVLAHPIHLLHLMTMILITMLTINQAMAQGEDLVALSVEGEAKADSPVAAAKEIQSKVIADVARAQVTSLIGEKKFAKNKSLIESKIIRHAAKFVPFVNGAPPVDQTNGSYKQKLDLKISLSSLKKMILEAGLLSEADGPAALLPLIAFLDPQHGTNYRWWLGDPKGEASGTILQLSQQAHALLQAEFLRQGFFMIKPTGFRNAPLPGNALAEVLTEREVTLLSEYFRAPLVLKGDVATRVPATSTVKRTHMRIHFEVIHAAHDRVVAEVSRTIELSDDSNETNMRTSFGAVFPEIAKDLVQQVLESWQKGTFNTKLFRLAVRGNLSPKQIGELKATMMKSVPDMKSIKERLFESGSVVFEIDFGGDQLKLFEGLKALQLPTQEARAHDLGEQGLALDVSARR